MIHFLMQLDLSSCAWTTVIFAALWLAFYGSHKIFPLDDLIDEYSIIRILGIATGICLFILAFSLGNIIAIHWLQILTIVVIALIGLVTTLANIGSLFDGDARAIDYAHLS